VPFKAFDVLVFHWPASVCGEGFVFADVAPVGVFQVNPEARMDWAGL
jgi:hypothetical protein